MNTNTTVMYCYHCQEYWGSWIWLLPHPPHSLWPYKVMDQSTRLHHTHCPTCLFTATHWTLILIHIRTPHNNQLTYLPITQLCFNTLRYLTTTIFTELLVLPAFQFYSSPLLSRQFTKIGQSILVRNVFQRRRLSTLASRFHPVTWWSLKLGVRSIGHSYSSSSPCDREIWRCTVYSAHTMKPRHSRMTFIGRSWLEGVARETIYIELELGVAEKSTRVF